MFDFNEPSGKNNCNEFRELFSLWLDGEISGDESSILEGHLLICESCRQELELWKSISQTLREDMFSGEPSTDFCAGVMNRLRKEAGDEIKQKSRPGIFHKLRSPAAAAAAAVMLFASSWGVNVALNTEKPKTEIAVNQPSQNNVDKNPVQTEPENTVRPENPERTADPGTNGGSSNEGNNAVSPRLAVQPSSPKPPAEALENNAVLLNSHRDILSTILKVTTPNVADNTNNALEMASRLGGSGQVLTSQKRSSGELAIVRIAVPRESGRSLVTQLSGLGGIIDRADEKRDVTASYTEARNRLSEIQTRISSGAAPDERSQLEAEASGLKRQIESWDKELGSYAIILWLEQ